MIDTIFVDTSVFRGQQFQFGSARFQTLTTLASHGRIRLLTTDVTVMEVHANIDKLFDEQLGAINQALAGARFVRRAPAFSLARIQLPLLEDTARRQLHEEATAFFSQSGMIVLKATDVPSARILSLYFDQRPPFGSGKKKSEFPDAFAATAILEWATTNQSNVWIVAEDGDWERVANESASFTYQHALPALVEKVLENEDNVAVVRTHQLIGKHEAELNAALAEAFSDEGFFLADVDGDVHSADANVSQVSASRVLGVDNGLATVELEIDFDANLEVVYDDPTSWIYDSEDKVAYYMNRIERTLQREITLAAEVVIELEETETTESLSISQITLNAGKQISVLVEDSD